MNCYMCSSLVLMTQTQPNEISRIFHFYHIYMLTIIMDPHGVGMSTLISYNDVNSLALLEELLSSLIRNNIRTTSQQMQLGQIIKNISSAPCHQEHLASNLHCLLYQKSQCISCQYRVMKKLARFGITFWTTATSLLNSIFVDMTSYLVFEGTICLSKGMVILTQNSSINGAHIESRKFQ